MGCWLPTNVGCSQGGRPWSWETPPQCVLMVGLLGVVSRMLDEGMGDIAGVSHEHSVYTFTQTRKLPIHLQYTENDCKHGVLPGE